MLRNRSRAVTRKQAIMADPTSLGSPSENHPLPVSSLFNSPRFFNGFFLGKGPPYGTEAMSSSPTSIKPFSDLSDPLGYDKNPPKLPTAFPGNKRPWEGSDPKPTGLALINSLDDSRPNSKMVLFGSELKIQIPSLQPGSQTDPGKSPTDFGIKTRNSKCSPSPFGSVKSGAQTVDSPTQITNGPLSVSEMELSEDYTCVIIHGPNPTTTHIYGDCIIDNCCVFGSTRSKDEFCDFPNKDNSPSKGFLSFCCTCKKDLGHGKDIYIYRGEKAFCSNECRLQGILFDGENDFGGCF